MSPPPIGIVTLIYIGVAVSEWSVGHRGMALMFAGYSIANVGLIWSVSQ